MAKSFVDNPDTGFISFEKERKKNLPKERDNAKELAKPHKPLVDAFADRLNKNERTGNDGTGK